MEPWTLWLIAAVALLVIEMITPGVFFFFCFGVAALLTAFFAYFNLSIILLWAIFLIVSVVFLVTIKPIFQKLMSDAETKPSNVDALIGKEAIVLEKIEPHNHGRVRVGGEKWRAEAGVEIAPDETVTITGVEGTRLIVERKS